MKVRVGLTTSDLTSLLHNKMTVTAPSGLRVQQSAYQASELTVTAKNGILIAPALHDLNLTAGQSITVNALTAGAAISLASVGRQHGATTAPPHYLGSLEIIPHGNTVRIVLISDLEDYVKGVLQSEMPASYHLEAIKCQAVAARTYALRPRINHDADKCNVCDSFLCCQYFAGMQKVAPRCAEAIEATSGEVLTYDEKPILALFSSNAGAHTESYEACFSDPSTGAFPPEPLPYLVSVSESKFKEVTTEPVSESALRSIWSNKEFASADAWSPHFRWHVLLSGNNLESHMHHQVTKMMQEPDMKAFVTPPSSGQFGHIQNFVVKERGVAGTVITLSIVTSKGEWVVRKELPIRNVFANPDAKLKRLSSARFFFEIEKDGLGLISQVTLRGLGWGHGVGMQQTGAHGWAQRGKKYREILAHYFRQAQITKQS